MKLRAKVVAITALLTLLGLGAGFGATHVLLVRLRLADLDESNLLLARVILEATLSEPPLEVPPAAHGYLVHENGVSAAQVALSGRLLWRGGPFEAPEPLDPEGLVGTAAPRTVGNWRVATLRQGALTVQVGRPVTALRAILRPYGRIAAALTAGLTALASVLAWFLAGWALRPLETLTEAARSFGDDAEVPTIAGGDEAAALARSFATLLDRLKRERARERGFMEYAAHELRTPISALRAGLEAARVRGAPAGPELLGRLHREALRLETFAQNLLALNRAEARVLRPAPLDLADLAAAAYDRMQPLALERGKELVLEAAAADTRADERLLEQALDNLVANAVRHATSGRVWLRTGTEGPWRYLEVADEGPGLPEVVREGLGLRVVRAVAAAHGGEVTTDGDGATRVRLRLPRRREPPADPTGPAA